MTQRARLEPGELLRRAVLFRTLAEGFAYPRSGHAAAMRRRFVVARKAHAENRRIFRDGLLAAWREVGQEALAAEYACLFLGNGPCSLHETAYGDGRRMNGRPVELADIGGFYSAFGMEPSASDPDLPDLLPTELEFHSILLVKQAYTVSRRLREQRDITEQAARIFLEQHLGRWVHAFAEGVSAHAALPVYRELARAVCEAVTVECRMMGVRPQPVPGGLPFDAMQAETFTCPLVESAISPPLSV